VLVSLEALLDNLVALGSETQESVHERNGVALVVTDDGLTVGLNELACRNKLSTLLVINQIRYPGT
jgi:hypothetical protein